jgi:protein-L-isoaspartate(D-aspartate) O-methyltransferase
VLEALEPNLREGAAVLDVGCGSGYLLAAFAHMVGQRGSVTGIEHIKELTSLSIQNIDADQDLGTLRCVPSFPHHS